jgi:hypothetical protein
MKGQQRLAWWIENLSPDGFLIHHSTFPATAVTAARQIYKADHSNWSAFSF